MENEILLKIRKRLPNTKEKTSVASTIFSIDLSDLEITEVELEVIANALKDYPNLVSLNLSNNKIGFLPSTLFAALLTHQKKIEVNLSGNPESRAKRAYQLFQNNWTYCEKLRLELEQKEPNIDLIYLYLSELHNAFSSFPNSLQELKSKYTLLSTYLNIFATIIDGQDKLELSENIDSSQLYILSQAIANSEINPSSKLKTLTIKSNNNIDIPFNKLTESFSKIFKHIENIQIIGIHLTSDLATALKTAATSDCKLQSIYLDLLATTQDNTKEVSAMLTLLSILESKPQLQLIVKDCFIIENDAFTLQLYFELPEENAPQIAQQLALKKNWKKIEISKNLTVNGIEIFLNAFSKNSQPFIIKFSNDFNENENLFLPNPIPIMGIDIQGAKLDDYHLTSLKIIITNLGGITYLNLSNTQAGNITATGRTFIDFISQSKIKELDFSNSKGFFHARPVVFPLDSLKSEYLENINLANCYEVTPQLLTSLITNNKKLRRLDVSGLHFGNLLNNFIDFLHENDKAFHIKEIKTLPVYESKFASILKRNQTEGLIPKLISAREEIIKQLKQFPTKNFKTELEIFTSNLKQYNDLVSQSCPQIKKVIPALKNAAEKILAVYHQIFAGISLTINSEKITLKMEELISLYDQIQSAKIPLSKVIAGNTIIAIVKYKLFNLTFDQLDSKQLQELAQIEEAIKRNLNLKADASDKTQKSEVHENSQKITIPNKFQKIKEFKAVQHFKAIEKLEGLKIYFNDKDLTLPDTVENILNKAFEGIEKFKDINNHKGITKILAFISYFIEHPYIDKNFIVKYYFESMKACLAQENASDAHQYLELYFKDKNIRNDKSDTDFVMRFVVDQLYKLLHHSDNLDHILNDLQPIVDVIDKKINYLTEQDGQKIRDLLTNCLVDLINLPDDLTYDQYEDIQKKFFPESLKKKSKLTADPKFLWSSTLFYIKGLAQYKTFNQNAWQKEKIDLFTQAQVEEKTDKKSQQLLQIIKAILDSYQSGPTSWFKNDEEKKILSNLKEIYDTIETMVAAEKAINEAKAPAEKTKNESHKNHQENNNSNSQTNKIMPLMTSNQQTWSKYVETLGSHALPPEKYRCEFSGLVLDDPQTVTLKEGAEVTCDANVIPSIKSSIKSYTSNGKLKYEITETSNEHQQLISSSNFIRNNNSQTSNDSTKFMLTKMPPDLSARDNLFDNDEKITEHKELKQEIEGSNYSSADQYPASNYNNPANQTSFN